MITLIDYQRITQLILNSSLIGKLQPLEQKLHLSSIIDSKQTPEDLVTMNSEVLYEDFSEQESRFVRLVYSFSPLYDDQVSVLSPLGSALLGMRINDRKVYKGRDGLFREIQVKKIIFQPESHGQYEL